MSRQDRTNQKLLLKERWSLIEKGTISEIKIHQSTIFVNGCAHARINEGAITKFTPTERNNDTEETVTPESDEDTYVNKYPIHHSIGTTSKYLLPDISHTHCTRQTTNPNLDKDIPSVPVNDSATDGPLFAI